MLGIAATDLRREGVDLGCGLLGGLTAAGLLGADAVHARCQGAQRLEVVRADVVDCDMESNASTAPERAWFSSSSLSADTSSGISKSAMAGHSCDRSGVSRPKTIRR
ncbi:hypothetical protein ACFPN0_32125 [Kitasatospora cinereorecta]